MGTDRLKLQLTCTGKTGATVLVLFASWTLACHAATLLHASLIQACLMMPLTFLLLGLLGKAVSRVPPRQMLTSHVGVMRMHQTPALLGALLILVTLHFSWLAFWAGSVIMLATACYSARDGKAGTSQVITVASHAVTAWIVTLCVAAALLTLAISRSDLDDAYYVAVAAFSAGHPHSPLLGTDPMFGQTSWPLLFPSYRFSAYEPLAGAIARALHIPAMDIMYEWLPPLGSIAIVGAIFFCTSEMAPKRWVCAGTVAILLMLLLGEEHRGAANFGFVRAFQGKALFLWIMVPTIFGLSFRYVSRRGRPFDLFLLACAQIASIGLSNYAILGAPLAGAVAAISAAPPFDRHSLRLWLVTSSTTLAAVPYIAFVAISSHDGSVLNQFSFEPPSAVWLGIFGLHQQFLVAFLILMGPFVASTPLMRWRLAIPPLILFTILLNPLLASWISRYVTSAPVYWRVTWSFPVLIYLGVAFALLIDRVRHTRKLISHATVAAAVTVPLAAMVFPGNVLRASNHVEWRFASRKLEPADSHVVDKILALDGNGRILADDSISGILAMHEHHPPLVNVRAMYLNLLRPYMSLSEYKDRSRLQQFVTNGNLPPIPVFKAEMKRLNVGTLALRNSVANYASAQRAILSAGFHLTAQCGTYSIWTKKTERSK